MSDFTHLHVHTEYSLLDGACRVGKLVERAAALGMSSVAITDHGNMYGVIDFYKAAKKAGVKPIIGCEVYVAQGSRLNKSAVLREYAHLVLLAKNNAGYKNLLKLVSEGFLTGYYYKPRIDYKLLSEHSEGLICLSACLKGDVQNLLMQNDYEGAKKQAEQLKWIFDDDFYLEIQDHGIEEQRRINPLLMKLSEETGIRLVATNDVHYVNKEDASAQDALLCIQTASTLSEPNRMSFDTQEFYLKSGDEMAALFDYVPDAVQCTADIAGQCNVELTFGELHLPRFDGPKGISNQDYLRKVAGEGLAERYPDMDEAVKERFEYEISTIESMGFTDYFLIVWDFVRFARQNGIMVGPGRGSAAGSIVAYSLGITNIDPIKYNLFFERFLNPERISMPDIDIDFCYERRGEVIDYVTQKYGEDRVAQIITFGTMGARLVLRDVARVMGVKVADADRLAKMVPFELKMTIDKALLRSGELRREYDENPQAKKVIDVSRQLEGMPRHASTHAAGVVISELPITEYVPLQKNPKDESVTTQFPMKQLEDLGLLKMDFLGLRTLTVIRDTLTMIEENHGISIDIDAIDIDDPEVYALIASADTEGIFQLESGGMRNLMKELMPTSLDDIMVGISLFRPGPMESIPEYISRKRDPGSVRYAHPVLEPILSDTYGCMVYQEQIMRIVRDVAGYSLARSDLVRRAMSKKQQAELAKERKIFISGDESIGVEGAVARGMDEKTATDLFDQMMAFANYAFNKSHACAYAVIAYQTAYLKRYYKVEFMTALLNSFITYKPKLTEYIQYLKRAGIKILPPDINRSVMRFSTEDGGVRFGLSAIAYVGEAIEEVIARRDVGYRDFEDFVHKNAGVLNKKRLESLILAGCFDCFGVKRAQLMAVYADVLRDAVAAGKRNADGQMSLFDSAEDEFAALKTDFPDMEEYPQEVLLAYEKEMTGFYISGHPLDKIANVLENRETPISDITGTSDVDNGIFEYDGSEVELLGIVTELRLRTTKQKKQMANFVLEDLYSQIDVLVFPNVLERYEAALKQDNIVVARGRVSASAADGVMLLAEKIETYRPDDIFFAGKQIYVKVPPQVDVEDFLSAAAKHPGTNSIVVQIEKTGQNYKLTGKRSVRYSADLIDDLAACLGEENVVVK